MVASLQRQHDDSIEILNSLQGHFPVEIELNRVSGVISTVDDAIDDDEEDEEHDDHLVENGYIFEPKPVANGEEEIQQDDLLLDLG